MSGAIADFYVRGRATGGESVSDYLSLRTEAQWQKVSWPADFQKGGGSYGVEE
jgi:hypothetical protein